jgi:serine/threonine protein kinase/tetratricopeptide (TPR) repeat protein
MIGSIVGHFTIEEKLGQGGMGVVYKATDTKLNRTVALKFLPPNASDDPSTKSRFLQEAQAAAALNHPSICTVYGVEEHDGQMFMAMEYVDGGTIRKSLPFANTDDVLNIALQIGEALQEAHTKGIVHRDVKAENIMLTARGTAKVMDFGLAKLKGALKLTKTSSTVGTLAYMAPEQIQGGEVDSRSDIFSFGVLLFEMLTGKLPYRGEHEAASRALEKDPADRYQSISDMDIDIRRLRKESSKVSRPSMPAMPVDQPTTANPAHVTPTPGGTDRTTTVTFKVPDLTQKRTLAWMVPLIIVIIGVAGYLFFAADDGIPAGERIPIAVTDVENQTDDRSLDGLSGMLITSLEQSKRLSVLTRSRMFDILKLLGKSDAQRIDEDLGRQISRHANVRALVVASISSFDQLYVVDMKVLDPIKNEYILTVKEQVEGKSNIPGLVDELGEQVRLGMKEAQADVAGTTKKVADLTTTNMDAYQEYFQGKALVDQLQFGEAIGHFRKAISIDSSFGLAWYSLSYALGWSGSPGSRDAAEKALSLINSVPDREKGLIRVQDALEREEPLEAIALLKELVVQYPDDKEINYLLGDYTYHQADLEAAITSLQKVIELDPTHNRAHQHLCWSFLTMNAADRYLEATRTFFRNVPLRNANQALISAMILANKLDSAMALTEKALQIYPDYSYLRRVKGTILLLQGKPDKARSQFRSMMSADRPIQERAQGHTGLADLLTYEGRFAEALSTLEEQHEILGNRGNTANRLMHLAMKTLDLGGDRAKANKYFEQARQIENTASQDYYFSLMEYYVTIGDFGAAREVANRRLKVVWGEALTGLQLEEALGSGNYGTAVEVYEKMRFSNSWTMYLGARTLTSLERYSEAISILSELRSSPVLERTVNWFPVFAKYEPLSYYLEGTIRERMSDRDGARKNYETFLKKWKDADTNIPEYADAKKRLAALTR